MIVILGLGNPGKKYEKTRHNLGYKTLDEFLKKNGDVHIFSNFKFSKKFQALISEGKFNGKKIILVKPQTFMNNSGQATKSLIQTYFINYPMILLSKCFWVVHDDIDLPLGKIRISIGRGSAGHKGVESIIKAINSKNFVRFRIGIKPQKIENRKRKIEKFVLQGFDKKERKTIEEAIEKTVEAIGVAIKDGVEKAMNQFNK